MKTRSISISVALLATSASLHAEVKPNPLFTDGAVLQRGQAVPVWGTARDGEKVTVEFGDQKLTTTAANGTWQVELKPLTAGGPFTMTIAGDNTVTVNNLLVGEVWVCSGQSNMEWPFNKAANAAEERPKAIYPKIRMFTVAKTVSIKPLAEARGSWVECSPETVGGFLGGRLLFRPRSLSETRHPGRHDPHLVGRHAGAGMDQHRGLGKRSGAQGICGCREVHPREIIPPRWPPIRRSWRSSRPRKRLGRKPSASPIRKH